MPLEVLQPGKRSAAGAANMRPRLIRLRWWKGRGSAIRTATERLCVGATWVFISYSVREAQGGVLSVGPKEHTDTIRSGTSCGASFNTLGIGGCSTHI